MKKINITSYGAISIAAMAVFGAVLFISPAISAAAYYYNQPQPYYNYQPQTQGYYGTPAYSYGYPQETGPVYSPLEVSCYPLTTSAEAGQNVTWTVSVSGGNGVNNVSWSGDEGLSGYGSSISKSYFYAGYKSASATVTSAGQTVTVNCSGSVDVIGSSYNTSYYNPQPYYYNNTSYNVAPVVYQPQYQPQPIASNASGLQIGCYADPTSATVNQPVTWNVEVTGGAAPYTYTWTGSDDLSGNQSSVIKFYPTTGEKSAIVTVTSADGRSATWACSNEVTVRGASTGVAYYRSYQAPAKPAVQPAPQQSSNQLSAVSLFSLQNVPWGWVAILIILVLFFTVLYLMFNQTKI